MSLLTIVLTTVLCGALGMWCGQRWTPRRPERLSATPPDAWMERHQRLRDQSKLAQRRHDLRHTRNEVQQQTLQLHLSPHFMFNALSSVQWLWSEHKRDRAARLFSNFVTLWRHHWRSQEASTHTLQEELASLQAYLTLEAQR
ncbi:MAG: histidine kinase, partial [Bacteroidota bacterium]|nr:histidine kinase [Bacteroidota bacterium]